MRAAHASAPADRLLVALAVALECGIDRRTERRVPATGTPGCSQTALSRARPSHHPTSGATALHRGGAGYMTDAFLEVYAMIDTCLKPSPSSAERIAPMRLSIISLGHTYASFYVRCGPSQPRRADVEHQ